MSWTRPGHVKSKNSLAGSNPDDIPQMSMREPDDIYSPSPISSPRKPRRDRQSVTPSVTATLLDHSPPHTPSAKAKGKQRESSSTLASTLASSSSVKKKGKQRESSSSTIGGASTIADNDPYPYPIRAPSPLDYDDTDEYGYPYASSLDPRPSTDSQSPLYGAGTAMSQGTYSSDAYSQHLRSLSLFSTQPINPSLPPSGPPPPPPTSAPAPPYNSPGVGPRKRDRPVHILNRIIKRMPTIESFGSRERDSRYRISTRAGTPTSAVEEEDSSGNGSSGRMVELGHGHRFGFPEEESEAEVEATLDDDNDDDGTETGTTESSNEYYTPPSRVDLNADEDTEAGGEGFGFDQRRYTGYLDSR